ncbi:hypothetical protein LCGC14_2167670 [marine sediment metagenome]|uniref:Uncharacterized protein n=1 Tax=marine sediment metagenome TaxID=412755 RepID=A0A0F9DR23_9ZZZZ
MVKSENELWSMKEKCRYKEYTNYRGFITIAIQTELPYIHYAYNLKEFLKNEPID